MPGHAYNAIERALHHLALGSQPVAELCFDLNGLLSSRAADNVVGERHVFVSGLARAGTTIIMRRLHETKLFRSLTYRDMPFVLCPNWWERLVHLSRRHMDAVERAHGDDLLVDFDSPEALDEVFWRVFAAPDYIKADHLCAHSADAELIGKFRLYVSYILQSRGDRHPKLRYLSKNNNNILRLGSIQVAFPESVILIPFRDPVQHACSLLNQHRKFSDIQGQDNFARAYMTWLAHHEFGMEHRPFWLNSGRPFQTSPYRPNSINYWLDLWLGVYRWILANRPANSLLVCYEDLCSEPAVWPRILERVNAIVTASGTEPKFRRAADKEVSGLEPTLAAESHELYSKLRQDFVQSLG
jgi:hypothetical protein